MDDLVNIWTRDDWQVGDQFAITVRFQRRHFPDHSAWPTGRETVTEMDKLHLDNKWIVVRDTVTVLSPLSSKRQFWADFGRHPGEAKTRPVLVRVDNFRLWGVSFPERILFGYVRGVLDHTRRLSVEWSNLFEAIESWGEMGKPQWLPDTPVIFQHLPIIDRYEWWRNGGKIHGRTTTWPEHSQWPRNT